MADISTEVITQSSEGEETTMQLPSCFGEYALVCQKLREAGLFEDFKEQCRLNRGGYQFIDVFMVALAYLSAYPSYEGLHEMLDEAARQGWGEGLAALAGRQRLPSQPSMSRALEAVTDDQADRYCKWLFEEGSFEKELSEHPSVKYRDCRGEQWDAYGLDGRVQAFRKRALPEGEEYPEPKRRVDRLGAKPGYAGRKRADVQMTRTPLQHLGSGRYECFDYQPGGGDWGESCEIALEIIEKRARRRGVSPERSMLVVDGETRGERQLEKAAESPVRVLTRLGKYAALTDRAVRERLADQTWERVRDAKSGPTRWATELGRYRVGGESYRLVVSRFDLEETEANGAGYQLDGYHYEIFATDLGAEAWPSSELVELYFGRAGRQENQFRLEDRAIAIHRVFSENPAGQRVMMATGMWLENIRTLLGAGTHGGLAELEGEPSRRDAETREGVEEGLGLDAAEEANPTESSEPAGSGGASSAPEGEFPATTLEPDERWWRRLEEIWEERLAEQEGWSFDLEANCLYCPNGQVLECRSIRCRNGQLRLRYRARRKTCRNCPLRAECTSSTRRTFRKEKTLTIPAPSPADSPSGEPDLSERLEQPRGERGTNQATEEANPSHPGDGGEETAARGEEHKTTSKPPSSPPDRICPRSTAPYSDNPEETAPGDRAAEAPVLRNSTLRKRFRQLAGRVIIRIAIERAPPPDSTPNYYVVKAAERQHRRQTWEQRHRWNGLREQTQVTVRASIPDELGDIFPPSIEPRAA